jgi:Putative transposase of IS4/5 family (DUF4096)/Transposase DDE domain
MRGVYLCMARRFEGLSDLEWKLFEDIFPNEPKKRGKGMPHAPYRHVLNSMLYILITGCRWCDLPRGNVWASKSSSHRWLKRWRSDGTFEYIQGRVLAMPAAGVAYANERGLINWDFGAVDGSFSPAQWEEVKKLRMEARVKVFLSTREAEGSGMPLANCTTPANGNEREQIIPLLDKVKLKTLKPGRPRKRIKVLAADKGYDSKQKRVDLRKRGIRPQIPRASLENQEKQRKTNQNLCS